MTHTRNTWCASHTDTLITIRKSMTYEHVLITMYYKFLYSYS